MRECNLGGPKTADRRHQFAADQEEVARQAKVTALDAAKEGSPDAEVVGLCRAVRGAKLEIPESKRPLCAKAMAAEGRVALRGGSADKASALLKAAKELGATDIEADLSVAEKKLAVVAAAAAKVAEAEAAKQAKVAAKEAKVTEADAAKAAAAGPKPTTFPRTGACLECEAFLETILHDPDSFSHDSVTEPKVVRHGKFGETWEVSMRYRAKNAMGGLILNSAKFWIKNGSVVDFKD